MLKEPKTLNLPKVNVRSLSKKSRHHYYMGKIVTGIVYFHNLVSNRMRS